MAKLVLVDAFVTVNAVDLSDCFSSVEVNDGAGEVDVTVFGSTHVEYNQGSKDAVITVEAFQDFAAEQVDDTLWPLYQGDEAFDVVVKAESGPAAPTNPVFRMTSRLYEYQPIAGEAGGASTTPLTFRSATPDGLVRVGSYVGIDGDGDPYFDPDGWYEDWAGFDVDTDPYIDVAGAPDPDVTVFFDADDEVAVEV